MIQERRKALKTVLATMKNSLKVLQRDPDIQSNTSGDEELEAILRQDAQKERMESKAGGRPGPGGPGGPPPGGSVSNRGPGGPGGPGGPPPGHGGGQGPPPGRGPPPGHPQYRGPPPGGP